MKTKLYFIAAIATLSLSSSYAQYPSNGLVGYYPFDNSIEDVSSSNLDLTSPAAPSFAADRFGTSNHCYSNNTRTYLPSAPNYTDFSFSIWVNPILTSELNVALISRTLYLYDYNTFTDVGKGGIYELYLVNTDPDSASVNISLHYGQTTQPTYTWENVLTATKKISYNDWSHLAVTYDATTNSVKLYVNGDAAGEETYGTVNNNNSIVYVSGVIQGYNALADMIIGQASRAGVDMSTGTTTGVQIAKPYDGKFDDFFIYNRVLSSTEVSTLYNLPENPTPAGTASVNEQTANFVNVYPNPTSDFMQVELTTENESAYSIYSADNREVMNGTLSTGNNSIDVQNLAAGTYFLKTTINGTVVTKKITKK
jgi:hypothetical protein